MAELRVLSVAQYLALVNETLRLIPSEALCVEGEISDARISQGKWVSFDLKDADGETVLKCFGTTWQITTPLEDGLRARVRGYAKVYERYGQFKMNVSSVELVGEGALKKAYEALKARLQKEGLFDEGRKRALPRFPSRIGLITSRDAAAYGDFMRVLTNRWAGIEVVHAHVAVQGRGAVEEIVAAFERMQTLPATSRPEVIVLTRGGGGLEDLHAFNDERVARAVFSCLIPVVCGIGHERDECLAEYAADMRASTPSNAAERLVPDRREMIRAVMRMRERFTERFEFRVAERHRVIQALSRLVEFALEREHAHVIHVSERLKIHADLWFPRLEQRLTEHIRVLSQLDPIRVLDRGYSILRSKGRVVRDSRDLDLGDLLQVQFAHGSAEAQVSALDNKGPLRLL